jgi:hypothetical protein
MLEPFPNRRNPFAESVLNRGEFSKLSPIVRIDTESLSVPELQLSQ